MGLWRGGPGSRRPAAAHRDRALRPECRHRMGQDTLAAEGGAGVASGRQRLGALASAGGRRGRRRDRRRPRGCDPGPADHHRRPSARASVARGARPPAGTARRDPRWWSAARCRSGCCWRTSAGSGRCPESAGSGCGTRGREGRCGSAGAAGAPEGPEGAGASGREGRDRECPGFSSAPSAASPSRS